MKFLKRLDAPKYIRLEAALTVLADRTNDLTFDDTWDILKTKVEAELSYFSSSIRKKMV